jgi:hypothetical protein
MPPLMKKCNYWHPDMNKLPLMFQKQVGKEEIFLKLQPQNLSVNSNASHGPMSYLKELGEL